MAAPAGVRPPRPALRTVAARPGHDAKYPPLGARALPRRGPRHLHVRIPGLLPGDQRVPTVGLFVGSVGGPPVSVTATKAIFGLARGGTAAFRISDGSAAWQDPGTWFACGQLPCPGQGLGGGIPTMGLRLRATGTVTSDLSTGTLTMSPGGTVTIEGFDLATGKTIWSYDAGSNVGLLDGQLPPVIGSEVVALPAKSSGEMVALNLATGKHAPVSPAAAGWCASSVQYKDAGGLLETRWRAPVRA